MTDFQAVDLDSILDEFESSQDQISDPPMSRTPPTSNPSAPPLEDLSSFSIQDGSANAEQTPELSEQESQDPFEAYANFKQPVLDDILPANSESLVGGGTNSTNILEPKQVETNVSQNEDVTFLTSDLMSSTFRDDPKIMSEENATFDGTNNENSCDAEIETAERNILISTLSSQQPDVLSGLEDVIAVPDHEDDVDDNLSQHIEVPEENAAVGEVKQQQPEPDQNLGQSLEDDDVRPDSATSNRSNESSSSSKSQSSEFESIYDKYRDKSTEEEEDEGIAQESSANKIDDKTAIPETRSDEKQVDKESARHELQKPVSFEPADVSNDELDEMLAELDMSETTTVTTEAGRHDDDLEIAKSAQASGAHHHVVPTPDTGAIPKDSSLFKIDSTNTTDNDLQETEVTASNTTTTSNEIPDIVMAASATTASASAATSRPSDSSGQSQEIPADSPPPYSEIDPMKQTEQQNTHRPLQRLRPNSLDVGEADDETPGGLEVPAGGEPGPAGSTPAAVTNLNPTIGGEDGGATAATSDQNPVHELLQGLTEQQLMLGKLAPVWVPDSEAANCMICDNKFTVIRRRHHCRACGQVLCSMCCNEKSILEHLEGKEGRVCKPCKSILDRLAKVQEMSSNPSVPPESSTATTGVTASTPTATGPPNRRPNPANPMEYCSTIPPHEQVAGASAVPPSVNVPVGVLKRTDSSMTSEAANCSRPSDPKSVMFSDGIRPGGDLTELDESPEGRRPQRRSRGGNRRSKKASTSGSGGPVAASDIGKSLMPHEGLPLISGQGPPDIEDLKKKFLSEESIPFLVNRNLIVFVKLVHYAPVSEFVWNFKTHGMNAVGQDEVAILLVKNPDEDVPPRDIFEHLQTLYEQASKGNQVFEMGHTVILSGSQFLGSTDFGGFLFFRHSFQCLDGLDLPKEPFLFAVLTTKWEMPWARVFPLRLLLRLGAESRYYPSPLWSWRDRTTVYKEIGNTMMKLLSDFRNFSYTLPIIRGMVIHMEDKVTTVMIPKNSFASIQRALANSNTPVLALGANFSPKADSHLVAVQRDEDEPSRNPMNQSDYETQAINIQNKTRKVTGASFIVLNGALKSASGLTAKSSIVEDGIMVQVNQDRMVNLRKSLNNMEEIKIDCGPVGAETPDETVIFKWMSAYQSINAGVKSHVDGKDMDGILSMKMNNGGTDFITGKHVIRWTEVFILPTKDERSDEDPARVAGYLARAVTQALSPNLKKLKEAELTPLAVRVILDPESACYEAGSKGTTLPPDFMNCLDNELIPIIHGQATYHASFEFVFHILDV